MSDPFNAALRRQIKVGDVVRNRSITGVRGVALGIDSLNRFYVRWLLGIKIERWYAYREIYKASELEQLIYG